MVTYITRLKPIIVKFVDIYVFEVLVYLKTFYRQPNQISISQKLRFSDMSISNVDWCKIVKQYFNFISQRLPEIFTCD